MNGNQQLLDKSQDNIDFVTDQSETNTADSGKNNNLAKIATGAIVGATLGAVAVALSIKGTAERINQTIQNLGNGVKGAADGVNNTVKGVGDAIKTVAESVNNTVKDVGDAVQGSAQGVNNTVINTVDVVKSTAVNVNETVKGTVDTVKDTAVEVKDTVKDAANLTPNAVEDDKAEGQSVKIPDEQATYILVPVDKKH
jgi:phage-related protein